MFYGCWPVPEGANEAFLGASRRPGRVHLEKLCDAGGLCLLGGFLILVACAFETFCDLKSPEVTKPSGTASRHFVSWLTLVPHKTHALSTAKGLPKVYRRAQAPLRDVLPLLAGA